MQSEQFAGRHSYLRQRIKNSQSRFRTMALACTCVLHTIYFSLSVDRLIEIILSHQT